MNHYFMMPGMNPKKMQQMMKQMGMKQDDIPARKVIIYTDDAQIIIEPCEVAEVNMMGQTTIQVTGDTRVEPLDNSPDISDEDIQTVVEQTGVSKEQAKQAIEQAKGDLAQAIMDLSEEQ